MSDDRLRERSPAPSAAELLELLAAAAERRVIDAGPGDLLVVEATVQSIRLLLIVFDYARNTGSIGTREADQLVRAIRYARRAGLPLVLLLETSGIRVTDETAGIASLRKVLREAEDARLDGTRMLAVVLKSAFGGASMLAALCERRLAHAGSLYSMSGPKLIEQSVGVDRFRAGDKDAMLALLGGAARAQASEGFVLVDAQAQAYCDAIVEWINDAAPAPLTLDRLAADGARLAQRLAAPLARPEAVNIDATALNDDGRSVLQSLFPAGYELRASEGVLCAHAHHQPKRRVLALTSADGIGAREALALAKALLDTAGPGGTPDDWTLLVDAESHRATPEDEQVVFSEVLGHLSLVIRALVRQGRRVDVVVVGRAGGGIQSALGSGASSVSMTDRARLSVLPQAALRALNKSEDPAAGSLLVGLSVGAVDQRYALDGHPNPGAPMSFDGNFYERFESHVRRDPLAPCLEIGIGESLSRGWLDAQSARYAHALLALGCNAGDRVASQVDKSPQALALYLGCLRAGLVFVPLNTAYQSVELSYLLSDAAPRVFVSRADSPPLPDSTGAAPTVMTLDERGHGSLEVMASDSPTTFTTVRCSGESIAVLVYTSGTTGRPKGAMVSHRAMIYGAETLSQAWKFNGADVLLHALPIFHGHGLMISANVALACGARMIFQPRFDIGEVIDALTCATVFMGVPTFYHRLLADARVEPSRCRSLRLFTCGSAPLSAEVHRAFAARTGHSIVERYGTTETLILCSNPIEGEQRPGSVGLPLPGVELRIADKDDRTLHDGDIGAIQVRGDGLFSGYWNMPAQTQQEFTADGWFRTGDLGCIGAGGYVSITGRSKDLVISGGYNVYPAEVETALNEMESVRESAIVGVPHPDFGEVVVAFVISSDPQHPPTPGDVIQWAKGRLANYKVPKDVHVVDELPRNAMGKVLKNKLRETLAAGGVCAS